jgi:hypothetical protein
MLEEKRLCGDGSYTTRAEELREGYKQVHGEDEEFAHEANGSTTTGAFKTARQRRSPSNYEFAIHRLEALAVIGRGFTAAIDKAHACQPSRPKCSRWSERGAVSSMSFNSSYVRSSATADHWSTPEKDQLSRLINHLPQE